MELSYSIQLVWPLASREALESCHEHIEPEHLFNALLKFAELAAGDLEPLLKEKAILNILLKEQAEIRGILEESGLSVPTDTTTLRRKLRGMMGRGEFKHDRRRFVHRSDAAKQFCRRAEELAKAAGKAAWQGIHLAEALLEKPEGHLAEALKAANVCKPAAVQTPLLDRFGSNLLPDAGSKEAVSGDWPADPVSKVILESIRNETECALVLIEKGGRTAREVVWEAAALLRPESRIRRLVCLDLARIEGEESQTPGILGRLVEEASGARAVLFLEGLAALIEKEDDGAGLMVRALEEKRLRCLCAVDEESYRLHLENKQPWRKLLQPVWIHPAPKLPW